MFVRRLAAFPCRSYIYWIWSIHCHNNRKFTVVKRTRVPAGYLVKMATDADVDSGRKRTLIQSVEAYTWNVFSGKIHWGIWNIQCKSRLRGTFHRCTIAPRKNIFWRGCFVFTFLSVSRVPVFFHEGTWHIHEGTCVVQGCLICFSFSLPRVSPNFGGANEATNLWTRILWWRIMFHVRAVALYPCNTMWNSRYILNYDDENVRKIQKHLYFNHKGTYIASECVACYPVF